MECQAGIPSAWSTGKVLQVEKPLQPSPAQAPRIMLSLPMLPDGLDHKTSAAHSKNKCLLE